MSANSPEEHIVEVYGILLQVALTVVTVTVVDVTDDVADVVVPVNVVVVVVAANTATVLPAAPPVIPSRHTSSLITNPFFSVSAIEYNA